MGWKSKFIKAAGIYSIGHLTGSAFGKLLHDYLAYFLPIKEFGKYPWFNPSQYIDLYKQYSFSLDNLFMWTFGIAFGGLALAAYLEYLGKKY
jgi:hypothetical protein